jgi:hypothetical protein
MARRGASDSRVTTAASGLVTGIVAWALGYAVTYLATGRRIEEVLSDFNAVVGLVGGTEVPTWKAVAWLYLNAHMVVVRVTGLPGRTRTYDFIAESGGSAPLLYVLPPVVVLVVVGVAVALGGVDDARSGAVAGGACTLGYLPVTALAALVSGHAFGAGVSATPAFVPALLLAGLVYPVVAGAVAGAFVGAVRS